MPVAFSAEREESIEKGANTSQLTYVTHAREDAKNCAANWLAYLEPTPPQNSLLLEVFSAQSYALVTIF